MPGRSVPTVSDPGNEVAGRFLGPELCKLGLTLRWHTRSHLCLNLIVSSVIASFVVVIQSDFLVCRESPLLINA